MKKMMLMAALVALAGTPVAAFAADTAPTGKSAPTAEQKAKMKERWQEHLKEVDKNGDGAVDKSEFLAQADKRFTEMDGNADGKITPEERKAAHEKMRAKFREFKGAGGPPPPGEDGPPPPPPEGE